VEGIFAKKRFSVSWLAFDFLEVISTKAGQTHGLYNFPAYFLGLKTLLLFDVKSSYS